MTGTNLTTFDLPADVERDVLAAAERIRVRLNRTAEDIIAVGVDLILIKAKLPHGEFLPWVDQKFGMAKRSAQRFIQVAQQYEGKSVTMAHFQPSVVYELAAPSTPDEVREVVEQRAAEGESVTVAEIKRLKREHAEEKEEAEARYRQEIAALREDLHRVRNERAEVSRTADEATVAAMRRV